MFGACFRFLEMGETAAQGAARETLEEANAHVASLVPFSHLDIPVIGQAYLLFKWALTHLTSHSFLPADHEVCFRFGMQLEQMVSEHDC